MRTTYYPEDDILKMVFNDQPILRETSQDWNVNISYAADGSIVEMVILDAVGSGLIPFHSGDSLKAA
ncbi:DUF2283 domain-containing protein [Methylophilus aquaticus]|uniref:DUF2283 domain-containing protein n=1 Tax=Methylophilus aquaticus TaxID=1971610 RepID=A0ABT9JYD8_9PROT|nr:DUF2283 domain-containing protein [Methylophilus aquaticus]MDP8568931.1 DUF2283 domain-containing protein [Methylophilus aquaticus]